MNTLPPTPPAAQPSPEQVAADVEEWRDLVQWLEVAKAKETALRQKLALHFFGDKRLATGAFPKGTVKLNDGTYSAKLTTQWNYDVLPELESATLEEADLGEAGIGLIKRKPELSLTVFNKLPPEKQRVVEKMLSIRQGSIKLEVNAVPQ